MSHKKHSQQISKNCQKKKSGSSSKKNSQKSKSVNKSNNSVALKKITDEREDFVYERHAKGWSCQKIADDFEHEYQESVTQSGVNRFLHRNEEKYQSWIRDSDCKKIRLANRIARILELQQMAEKLGKAILEIIEEVPKGQWDDIHVSGLVKQYRELLAQIQDESGDKVHKVKAEGITGDFIFGDKTINVFADKTVEARTKETVDSGNRFKKAGLSDFGNSLSGN